MKKLNVILVDDEADSLEVLELMLKKSSMDVEIRAMCKSAGEAIEQIQMNPVDLLFLDIEMPGSDGFTVLRAFNNPTFKVIIVTGYEQYALRAIKFAAVDYLLKPIEMNELNEALEKVVNTFMNDDPRLRHLSESLRTESDMNKIIIPHSKGFRTLLLKDIICIESMPGGYSLFRLKDHSNSVVTKTLSYFEDILPPSRFRRVHRSSLVNLEFVKSYDSQNGIILLENGQNLEVSVRRRADFYSAFKEYMAV